MSDASNATGATGGATAATAGTVPGGTATAERPTPQQKPRQMKVGRVVSNKMDKSVVVAVDYVKRHPIYHKRLTRTSRFMAHDEHNRCSEGDIVRIEETRPLSAKKRWIVREIVQTAPEN